MDTPTTEPFSSHAQFNAALIACIGRSHALLQLFDPDFAVFALGGSAMDAALRHFLAGGGNIELALRDSGHIERHDPRFLQLLKDFSHRIACRRTPPGLRQLSDSFCIGDGVHIVRRFHSDHMRGEASWHAPQATEISRERFSAIWQDSLPSLHPTTTGL